MVTRIGDEVAEYPIYRDELGITAYGANKGRNYKLTIPGGEIMELLFQTNGGPNPQVNGLTNEILIAVLIDRLSILNQELPSQQNLRALNHLEDALANLESRSLRRNLLQITQYGSQLG